MNAPLGEIDLLRDLAARLAEAKHGEKTGLVDAAARTLSCSVQDVYRRLRVLGIYDSGRKPRKDRGTLTVPEDVAVKAAALVTKATRRNGKRTMPITVALDVLRENGEGAVDAATGEVRLDVSASTLSRAMRTYGCHPATLRQGRAVCSLRSEHPNHVWQVDASICVLFYLPDGGLKAMSEAEYYKNKPANLERIKRLRVWRYVITDHYSGCLYVRYVASAGETAEGLTDVFLHAITKRGQDDPMHGVPLILLMDQGSANLSKLFINLLKRLDVRHLTNLPGNPRAKGQVEQAQNLVETQFEGRLAYMRVQSLEQLQDAADKWRAHYNAWAHHARHGKSRNDLWLTISEEQLRLAPAMELCRELVTMEPVEVRVRPDMTITHKIKGYGRQAYDVRLLPGLTPRCKVQVVVNPYRVPAVDVIVRDARGDEQTWTVEPILRDEAGFRLDAPVIGQEFKSLPDTVADKRVKEIDAAVPATGRDGGEAPYGLDVMADVREAPTYITRRGRDLGLDASRREIAPLSVVEAAKRLRAQLGASWTAESYAWLAQRYPGGVPESELDGIAARLVEPETKPTALKLVAAGGAR